MPDTVTPTAAKTADDFQHVHYGWDDAKAQGLSAIERLVYRSNLLGSDQRITNTGGGNTSAKARETDPLTGEKVDVLWVKGSGGDLRTSKAVNFASLYMEKLLHLEYGYGHAPRSGPKTPVEDAMVEKYRHCTFNLNPRASSIDTPLHGYLPAKHVDHMHPNAVISIAASKNQEALTQEVWGERVAWTPWQRPGFDLGLVMRDLANKQPQAVGILMGQHGIINWDDDDKACYELTLELIETAARFIESKDKGDQTFGGEKVAALDESDRKSTAAAIMPWLRGQVSQQKRFIGTFDDRDAVLRFVGSVDAPRLAELGTSCPDHFLRTKIKPLYVDWNPASEDLDALKAKLTAGLEQYRKDYAAYYEACKHDNSPAMRDPNPTVILIPGVGMIAWGKNKSESRVTAEFYHCAIEVMRGAEAIDEYIALPQQEAFDIEYWLLEEAKLKRMPPEKELARKVVAVIGAGSGIGKAVAHRLAKEGAHVVCADLNAEAAQATADELTAIHGQGIGVAGTGVSSCGPAIGTAVNVTDRSSVKELLDTAALAYGGLDHIVVTAGVFATPGPDGKNTVEQWRLSFDVNVMGMYQMVDEAKPLFAEQNLPGSVVLTTSVNAVVAKKGTLAYDTSKAAANHLVRELAVELSPLVRVNGLAPATVVKGSTMFPRDRVISSLKKYDIDFEESWSDDELRNALAEFYAQRTLTKSPITPDDQAETVYFLVSDASSKTTGQVFSVDGGLHEAFLR
ncbi:MAG: bifunctional rhamnulose-1-phosphate aldolase/short-chain dehydrogenase [Planctomycetota bacterium]